MRCKINYMNVGLRCWGAINCVAHLKCIANYIAFWVWHVNSIKVHFSVDFSFFSVEQSKDDELKWIRNMLHSLILAMKTNERSVLSYVSIHCIFFRNHTNYCCKQSSIMRKKKSLEIIRLERLFKYKATKAV